MATTVLHGGIGGVGGGMGVGGMGVGGMGVGGMGVGMGGGGGMGVGGVGVGMGGGSVGVGAGAGATNLGMISVARKINIGSAGAAAAGGSMNTALVALSGSSSSYQTYAGRHELSQKSDLVVERLHREKKEIAALNEKHAEKVRAEIQSKAQVELLQAAMKKMTVEFESFKKRLAAMYGDEKATFSATLDATVKELGAARLKAEDLEKHYYDIKKKYEEEKYPHERAKARIATLEKEHSVMTAEIEYLKKTIEPQLVTLKEQIVKYQKESVDAKCLANDEILKRVEIESKLTTLTEEMAFVKTVYEEELRMALDFDFEDVPFSNDFALALRDIREEYQKQLAALKGTDDAWFKEKVTTCLGGLERQNKEMKLLKDEIASLKAERSTFYALKTEFKAKEAAWLEEKATWEGQMTAMRQGYELTIQEKDAELAGLREKLMTALHDLKNLVDVKLSMDEEIGVYQKLLQVRASSSTTVVGGGTTVVGGGTTIVDGGSSITTTKIVGGGGGGLLVGGGGSTTTTTVVGGGGGSGVVIGGGGSAVSGGGFGASAGLSFTQSSKGQAAIVETATDGRYVTVQNKTGQPLDLSGWAIERTADGEFMKFVFPAGTTAGASLTIWANGAVGASNAAGNMVWAARNTWGQAFNATNVLKNALDVEEATLVQATRLS